MGNRLALRLGITLGLVLSLVGGPFGPGSATSAHAQSPPLELPQPVSESHLSFEEFQSLVLSLSHKVAAFHAVWTQDPDAEFFGGTTRDFAYWVKGQFRNLRTRTAVLKKIRELNALPTIDVRDFIIGESDLDIATSQTLSIDAKDYGLSRIDFSTKLRFDPETAWGRTEIDEGGVPVEKIRLARDRFNQTPGYADGLREIYSGRLTVTFTPPEVFWSSYYASHDYNHPILLAVRYLRDLAVNYRQTYGPDYPNKVKLFDIDPLSNQQIREVVQHTWDDPKFIELLKNPRFLNKLNETIGKAFRAYTNPTAAHLLFEYFGLDKLFQVFGDRIVPINQFLFAKYRDPLVVEGNYRKYNVDLAQFFSDPATKIKNLTVYHGTKSDKSYRDILIQGALPSTNDTSSMLSAGHGLYVADSTNLSLPLRYAESVENHVVSFQISPQARFVDVTEGEGQRVFQAFGGDLCEKRYDEFAEAFGVDVIRYTYDTRAFVVKNASVLSRATGYKKQVLTVGQFLIERTEARTDELLFALVEHLQDAKFTPAEEESLLREKPAGAFSPLVSQVVEFLWNAGVPAPIKMETLKLAIVLSKTHQELAQLPGGEKLSRWKRFKRDQSLADRLRRVMKQVDETHAGWRGKPLDVANPRAQFYLGLAQALVTGNPAFDQETVRLISHGGVTDAKLARAKLFAPARMFPGTAMYTGLVGGVVTAMSIGLGVDQAMTSLEGTAPFFGAAFALTFLWMDRGGRHFEKAFKLMPVLRDETTQLENEFRKCSGLLLSSRHHSA